MDENRIKIEYIQASYLLCVLGPDFFTTEGTEDFAIGADGNWTVLNVERLDSLYFYLMLKNRSNRLI